MLFFNLASNPVGGFPDYDKVQLNSSQGLGIGAERTESPSVRKSLNFGDRIQDVLNSIFPISRRRAHTPPSHVRESEA
jgi:hypothetical protein